MPVIDSGHDPPGMEVASGGGSSHDDFVVHVGEKSGRPSRSRFFLIKPIR
jgi:hypothetical protein